MSEQLLTILSNDGVRTARRSSGYDCAFCLILEKYDDKINSTFYNTVIIKNESYKSEAIGNI